MWAHAEDLVTLEFALMQVVSYITGPVCNPTDFVTCSCCLYRLQDVSTDLADEVHVSPRKAGDLSSLRSCRTDYCIL